MPLNHVVSAPALAQLGVTEETNHPHHNPEHRHDGGNPRDVDATTGDACTNNGDAPAMTRVESTFCFSDLSKADESEESASSGDEAAKVMPYVTQKKETAIPPHTGYKKVLVTGGAGFIGSHVANFLLNRGDDVVIVDEMNDYYDPKIKQTNIELLVNEFGSRVKFYVGDICDIDFIHGVFEREHPKWVCHMAARAGVRPSIADPFVYIHSNIRGTTQLMELSHQFGVENFVFASSSSVYGGSKNAYFSEEECVDNPVSPYAASKKACELLAYTYHHLYKLNISGLRFFTVYGPRGRPDMAPFKFIDRISRGLEIQQFGDGSSSRDYTYIDDIVDGIVRAIDRPHKYEVFNVGKGSGTSLKEFIDLVQKYTEKKAIINVKPDQPGDVPYTCADVNKASKMLGYRATVPFEEGIRRTVQWYKSEQKNIEVCPELQANGMGRAASFSELSQIAN
mmetsp:Transcript_22870/g.33456  ORF Transcript_22870/g.33456 Transcript_22870/m.33456 type:complete len:452 (+) Transcript_22870:232-1587(+)|eukprot:CAMPEP_0195529442 /NCGR_PEP_ID=MMETSP0794_2-20130614/31973_1 /TAXON_ID=515487 /ORGANISM="Stephanopyxis turris, Strain CCMP 815" /LENGTH=451 /DNA_ID=CAMNT_0040660749 /DNA_START=228 /DNA_END=1583 /DNA_ORIENTATION=+